MQVLFKQEEEPLVTLFSHSEIELIFWLNKFRLMKSHLYLSNFFLLNVEKIESDYILNDLQVDLIFLFSSKCEQSSVHEVYFI